MDAKELKQRTKEFAHRCVFGVHRPRPNAWRAGVTMRIKAVTPSLRIGGQAVTALQKKIFN